MKSKLVLVIFCGVAVSATASQQPSEELPPADRIVVADLSGGPWMFSPPIPTISDESPLAIGKAAGIVVGFEMVPEAIGRRKLTPAEQSDLKGRERISLAGKTVAQALDAFVANDPRYHWIDVHGVPVVRPRAAWVDPRNPLNRIGGPIDWREVKVGTALRLLAAGLRGQAEARLDAHPADHRSNIFSVRLGAAGLLEMLNEIAKAHGGMMWEVRHQCLSPQVTNRPKGDDLEIGFSSHDGWGSASCFVVPLNQ